MKAEWFIVVGQAKSGVPQRDVSAAWASYYRRNQIGKSDECSFDASTAATLYSASTHTAALAADISEVDGQAGAGRFWRTH